MIEPTFLSTLELADRWEASVRQILEHGINRVFPVLFAFDGLAFDQSERWLTSVGAHDEQRELEFKKGWVEDSEAHLRRNAAGNVDEFTGLNNDEVIALRQRISAANVRIQELSELLESRDQDRRHRQFFGYMRAPPRLLWDLMQGDETVFPLLAFHPQSDIHLTEIDGKTFWDGRMMTLEPDISGAWRSRIRASDLLIPLATIKAIENARTSGTQAPERPRSVAAQQDEAILSAIASRGVDPLALPPYTSTGGIKSEIKLEFLSRSQSLFTKKTFDTAWSRLSSSGRLAWANKPQ